jgi:hypothetical protein
MEAAGRPARLGLTAARPDLGRNDHERRPDWGPSRAVDVTLLPFQRRRQYVPLVRCSPNRCCSWPSVSHPGQDRRGTHQCGYPARRRCLRRDGDAHGLDHDRTRRPVTCAGDSGRPPEPSLAPIRRLCQICGLLDDEFAASGGDAVSLFGLSMAPMRAHIRTDQEIGRVARDAVSSAGWARVW